LAFSRSDREGRKGFFQRIQGVDRQLALVGTRVSRRCGRYPSDDLDILELVRSSWDAGPLAVALSLGPGPRVVEFIIDRTGFRLSRGVSVGTILAITTRAMSPIDDNRATWRPLLTAAVAVVALAAGLVWLAFALLRPTPPKSVTMATDPEGSINAELAERYRDFFARNGIDLKLVPLTGAMDSLARLQDAKSGVSIAILPSGITTEHDSPHLVSLGTLFYEPLWFFLRDPGLQRPEQLRGLRLSIGPEGSGSRKFSLEFFDRAGIIDQKSANLLPFTPAETTQRLERGELDGAVLLDSWNSRFVQELLTADNVTLVNIRRADAFVALYPHLSKLVLPAGVADLAKNRPPTDVLLLAPKASLVVRRDLHPAIQYLLLEAAEQFHSVPGVFQKAGEFPAAESIDLPLSSYARQFYKTGSPFLQRHLPLWLAVLIEQLFVLAIPLVGVIFPLLRFAPAVYNWAARRRIYLLYSELKRLEDQLAAVPPGGTTKDFLDRLNEMEERASRQSVPAYVRPQLYWLRLHVEMVREEVLRKAGTP
jgi:TRAP-type uncharacterized transport system substrate-binding protein